MEISAHLRNGPDGHSLVVSTDGTPRPLVVSARASGQGSAVNGGELLMAALATCYCNDLYREAARLGVAVIGCEVRAHGRFDGVGLPARDIIYAARVKPRRSRTAAEICAASGASVPTLLRYMSWKAI